VAEQESDPKRVTRKIDYTKLKKTWSLIENWLGLEDGCQRMEQLRLLVTKMNSNVLLSDFLFAQYPRTAFTICNYYNLEGMRYSLLNDPARRKIRLESLVKLSKVAFEKDDLESLFYYLSFLSQDEEKVVAEAAYWKLIGEQIGHSLKSWANSDQPVLPDGMRIRLAERSWDFGIDIFATVVKQANAGAGGAGGGMGGMGGGATDGLPTTSKAKTSRSIELLAAYEMLPEEFRPKEAMEEVRKMLAKHLGDTTERADELFPMEWSQLQWNHQFRLEFNAKNGKPKSFRPEDQQSVEAFALHRWVSFLLDSDQLNPASVCSIFFQEWKNIESSDARSNAKQWIVSRGREAWSAGEPIFYTHPSDPGFNPDIINSRVRQATVKGKHNDHSGMGASGSLLTFELELVPEGWRIRRLTAIGDDNKERIVFEY